MATYITRSPSGSTTGSCLLSVVLPVGQSNSATGKRDEVLDVDVVQHVSVDSGIYREAQKIILKSTFFNYSLNSVYNPQIPNLPLGT